MNILSINTSTRVIDVALQSKDKIFNIEKDTRLGDYEDIVSLIKSVLRRAKLKLGEIDYFGVCIGPGSFTGMRIGLSTMKALAYSTRKPLIGFGSLDAEAYTVKGRFYGQLCIMLDAKRNNAYTAVFNNNNRLRRISPYLLLGVPQSLQEIKKFGKNKTDIYFCGDMAWHYKEAIYKEFPGSKFLEHADASCRSKAMISLTKDNIKKKSSPFDILPLYMYPRDCQVSKPLK
jgi:tRNA threonylcarbamoyladenosine biosynthesis protein TsaB